MSAQKRILIVDDDPDVHQLLMAALAAPDRQIESASDGLAGLRCIEVAPYDLVMTDVNMPGLDGMALLERIRSLRPDTRVLVMTVANTPENVIRAIRERAFSYFSKPFTINSVIEMVDRALTSSAPASDIEVLSARPNWLELRLACKMETADRILQFLRELGVGLRPAERDNIATAFREILLNAIEHGGGSDPLKTVTVTYIRTERAVLYFVRDPGKGFSFQALTHAAVANPLDSPFEHAEIRERMGMRPGGFGIFMTRELVDEVIYNEKGNEVLLIKYLR
ncbi:MAG TPA: response regulator [Bryobacteraceae bacterium]|jgi:CheY-like chemotaxis protein/anti-sigma regulatory factor (Ser/Thr protein kinase)|nr:response regulator [Bryobacteraceae bacterium]